MVETYNIPVLTQNGATTIARDLYDWIEELKPVMVVFDRANDSAILVTCKDYYEFGVEALDYGLEFFVDEATLKGTGLTWIEIEQWWED